MPQTFSFITDPGHGWLMVRPADLAALNLTMNDFSAYSYIDGSNRAFYLEEDCDASKFIEAYKAKHGAIHFTERHTDNESPVRRMRRNQPIKAGAALVI